MPSIESIVLGFDFGEVRIGVAVGNRITHTATAHSIITGASNDEKFLKIGKMIAQWQPATLVVGRPTHPDGAEHEMTARCEKFARQLEGRFHLPIAMTDERYSSAVTHNDAEAAAEILQQYLNNE
jgi:putative holliday junction resolvase